MVVVINDFKFGDIVIVKVGDVILVDGFIFKGLIVIN